MQRRDNRFFLALVVIATIAFGWILLPLYGAILWGLVTAILFNPLNMRLRGVFGQRRGLAALATLLAVIVIVVVPLLLVSISLGQQASGIYTRIQSGELDFTSYYQQVVDALPAWLREALDRFGLSDISAAREKLVKTLTDAHQIIAARALGIGLGAFDFVLNLGIMLYLLFFLLRDGDRILSSIRDAVPLSGERKELLAGQISLVVRATVMGGIIVAAVQGMLGGLAFWYLGIPAPVLWAVVMAFLSLLPAIGATIVWGPVAIYLVATGKVWDGAALTAYGILVIGLIDNLLRPFLVGKSTKLPDYVVLISTLGGIALLGLNGFVVGPLVAAIFMVSWASLRPDTVEG